MEKKIKENLYQLREYGLSKNAKFSLLWHYEDSHFIRYANSGISLNTSERLNRLFITVYGQNKMAESSLILDPDNQELMKRMFDEALLMLESAATLSFQPNLYAGSGFFDQRCYDPQLADLSKDEMIDFVNQASRDLETEDIMLSGNFSKGVTMLGQINSLTEEVGFWAATDAQITLVLSSVQDKWEINAEQSAVRKADLNAQALHEQLSFMTAAYLNSPTLKLPLGRYRTVFGPAAIAEYLSMLEYIGYDGDMVLRKTGMHKKEDLGQKIFSAQFNLYDDPDALATFAFSHDLQGRKRTKKALYEQGVFQNFTISQRLADEFKETANAMEVLDTNLVMSTGDQQVNGFDEIKTLAAEKDILYIPYLHYSGVVNSSEGLVTGSSRFGALLFRQDGSIEVPYNVRFTVKLADIFGDNLLWLARDATAYNISSSYGMRSPDAILLPKYMAVEDVRISHSNDSY